jgi:hypothetical protein
MQITFAGIVIANPPSMGGFQAVTGFLPQKKSNLQWGEFLRAQDAVPFARGNRKRTLAGTITQEYDSLGAAVQAALTYLDGLPDAGILIIAEAGVSTLFAAAVLTDLKVRRVGVTVMADLTFAVGPGVNYAPSAGAGGGAIETESGSPILTESGETITPE